MDQASNLRKLVATRSPVQALRVIAVTSGKGGVGKTNITSNLAILAAQAGQRVLVIDADLGLANIEIVFGLTPKFHIGHLLDGTVPVQDVLTQGPHGISVLSANSGTQALTQLDDAQKLRLITALDPLEDAFDLHLAGRNAAVSRSAAIDRVLAYLEAVTGASLRASAHRDGAV